MRFRFQKVVNPKPKLVLVQENKSNYILPGEELYSRSLVSLAHLSSRSLGQGFGHQVLFKSNIFKIFLKKYP
jgi:hypothetical protein